MPKVSYATSRKIRILEEKVGKDWKKQYPGQSVDAVFNHIMGDTRKNLFCKIEPTVKAQLDEMVDSYDLRMSELVERLIRAEYSRYAENRKQMSEDLANEFTSR